MKSKFCTSIALLICLFSSFAEAQSGKKLIVGTGDVTGVYYPAGGAICRNFNRSEFSKKSTISCVVESTWGSVANIEGVNNKSMDFGIVQEDLVIAAINNLKSFKDKGNYKGIRKVLSLHDESFVMVVRSDSNIKDFDGIRGKIVNFGNTGSSTYTALNAILEDKGWKTSDFKKITNLTPTQQPAALCNGEIDVMTYIAGHPNGAVQEAGILCQEKKVGIRIINADISLVSSAVKKNNLFYTPSVIPGGMYIDNPNTIKTFGTSAILIASDSVPDEYVYNITKEFFENYNNIRTLHPVFYHTKKEDLIRKTLVKNSKIEIHPGAMKYYKEQGFVK